MALTIVSFVLVMGIIVFFHELGHFLVAKRSGIVVEEFGFGYPPRLLKLGERDGTVYTINAIPFGGFVRMRGEDDPTLAGSFASAPRGRRAATLLAGAFMNLVLAVVLFATYVTAAGVPDASRTGTVIRGLAPDSPAQQAGLQIGDRIIGADGVELATLQSLQDHTKAHLGKPVVYEIVRGESGRAPGKVLKVTMTPRTNPPANQGALGVQIGPPVRTPRILEALGFGVQQTGQIIWMTFAIPAMLLREGRPIADMGFMGPVGIAATTGDVVRSALAVDSITPVIFFVALLSVAVGVTNLLPIPGLDGGRLLFVIVEAIRRKRVEPAQEGMVHLVGLGLLLLLVSVLTVREISALVSGTFSSFGAP